MGKAIDLSHALLGLFRDGRVETVEWNAGPPPRVDGYTIGLAAMTRPAPHNGEMHPDADEILVLVSGSIDVLLEQDGVENLTEVRGGQAFVVPRGTWHRVVPREPSVMVHITPGPGGDWRPL